MATTSPDTETDVLRCLAAGRTTIDLVCDSLELRCHEVREVLHALERTGAARPRAEGGLGVLTFDLTDEGRRDVVDGLADRDRLLAERGHCSDDVLVLRRLAAGQPPPRRAECEWGVVAARQRLWETGLIEVSGFAQPRMTVTPRGRAVLAELEARLEEDGDRA